MSEQSWVIETKDLQIGSSLSFDLTDANGQILLKAGIPINERLKERLEKKNIQSVTVRGAASIGTEQAESLLLSSYPPVVIQAIQESIENTRLSVVTLVDSLRQNRECNVDEISVCANQFVHQASKELAATLAVLATRSKQLDQQITERIARQSTKIALIGVVMSVVKNDDPSTSFDIGLAGLLHDISLSMHPEWFSSKPAQRDETYLKEYRRHPIESAELLIGMRGISKNLATIITQVHEQVDGTGYPRGLMQNQTLPSATILNLADAYFSLTEPIQGVPWVPTDAMAYLCYQAAQGTFCKSTLSWLIQCISMYPVGSTVCLDDSTNAVVIQGNNGKPLQPIVRLLEQDHMRIDLRESKRFITGPVAVAGSMKSERIKKSQMQEIIWRTDR